MKLRPILFACAMFSLLVHGCQSSPVSTDIENRDNAKPLDDVVVGSVTEGGELERKYNQIQRGMSESDVQAILGRRFDSGWAPGGSLGNRWLYWYEDHARLFVDFEFGSGKVCDKRLTPTDGNKFELPSE